MLGPISTWLWEWLVIFLLWLQFHMQPREKGKLNTLDQVVQIFIFCLFWLPIFRFNLHKNWITTSFVLNLAISDILYSVFYFIGNIDGIWTYKYSCYVVRKLIGNTLLYSEWMSIAMIAVVRCNGIMKSGKPSMFSSRRTRYLVFVLIRLLCVTFLLPLPSKVRFIAPNYKRTKTPDVSISVWGFFQQNFRYAVNFKNQHETH